MPTALRLLCAPVMLLTTVSPSQTRAQEPKVSERAMAPLRAARLTRSDAVFRQLTSVVGDWEGIQDGVPIKVTYTLLANGTALMEHVKPGDSSPMITMFTVDGDRLIATHYCVTGNQPQMVAGAPVDLHKGVAFSLAQITGMKTPEDWHNTGVTITLDDKDHMTQRWTYLYKGKAGTTVFHYVRKT